MQPPIDILCTECLNLLWARSIPVTETAMGLPVRSLWIWKPEIDSLLRPFLYGFKGGFAVRIAEEIADRWLTEWKVDETAPLLLVHPPASGNGIFDHSHLLIEVLKRRLPAAETVVLQRRDSSRGARQKNLAVVDRMRRRFKTIDTEKISRFLEPRAQVIFVDDVVTSGATALAAFEALGQASSFTVWTIAIRPKLAGKSAI